MAGVFDNPPGFTCTPPGVDILEGGKLTPNNVVGSSHDPLQSPAVASGAASKPGGDTAGQDALHSAGVEGPDDSGARSKRPQPSQEEETLMCLLQHCICVSRPCEILGDVNAEELKAGQLLLSQNNHLYDVILTSSLIKTTNNIKLSCFVLWLYFSQHGYTFEHHQKAKTHDTCLIIPHLQHPYSLLILRMSVLDIPCLCPIATVESGMGVMVSSPGWMEKAVLP